MNLLLIAACFAVSRAAGAAALDGSATHSALRPAGVQAARIHELWNLTLWVCCGVFAAVLLTLMLGLIRARRASRAQTSAAGANDADANPAPEPRTRRWVQGASMLSALLLVGLLVADILTDRAISRLPVADALHIEMIGHQWWWETRYPASDGQPGFAVAADLHVPVGRPLLVTLKSVDVIHTFWVPSLHGKKDMLPGRTTDIALRADQPGVFRGECAEFCGLEHALMAFSVTAEPPDRYAAWQAAQQAPAAQPAGADALRGQQLFQQSNCAQCHTVRGTSAEGSVGPDLTHVASRPMLAAGTLPNTPEALAAWIVDPQSRKPGATMPPSALPPDDVRALVAYLGALR